MTASHKVKPYVKKSLKKRVSAAPLLTACTLQPALLQATEEKPAVQPDAIATPKLTVVPATPGSQEEMVLKALVGSLKSAHGVPRELSLQVGKPIEAVRKGEIIEVALLDTRLTDPAGNGIQFGDFVYRTTPGEDEKFSYQLTIPSQWIILDKGKPLLTVDIADQHCNGSYWQLLSTGTDCRLESITVQTIEKINLRKGPYLTINSVSFQQAVTEQDGVIGGKSDFNASGIHFDSGSGQQVEVEKIISNASLEKFSLPLLLSLMEQMDALVNIEQEELDKAENQKLVLNYILGLLRTASGSSLTSDGRIVNLTYSEDGLQVASLDEIGSLASYTGQEELSDLRGSFHFRNLHLSLPQVTAELQPISLQLDITVARLPLIRFLESLATLLPVGESDRQLIGQLLQKILLQQPPLLKINKLQIAGGKFDLQFIGTVEPLLPPDSDPKQFLANSDTPLDFLDGHLKGTINELDFISTQAAQRSQQQPELMQVVLVTSLIRGFGEAIEKDQYAYDIVFSPEKGLVINGKDMSMLLMGLQAPQP
ncbi:hypothetical protein [Solemya velum gill symbiont]|uniref:hypothetical protein n=1 Tax=Solemya velum gill symbiont TaxID=2340 RepID=UPI000996CFC9|nr:hypothetical protein [Solemya velum gill symbiont]OOY56222.1 hypothetical protein BOW00_07815 [Solemya velum gill symbiont]OOY56560.1 hypothetical protein BOV99_04250 [Solemya velum gill symbiont]OOY70108.1 hypothetical protein BOW07_05530 [Solemya velum gill symbiont]OOY94731.1 hypothetical protein BOW17_05190 [Solemya velum gill symbiont]